MSNQERTKRNLFLSDQMSTELKFKCEQERIGEKVTHWLVYRDRIRFKYVEETN